MDDLLAARLMMAVSLGFHIIYACIGMTMPFFMATSHYLYLKKGNSEYLELTKMWSKGVAILFATGAVSGTVLSFELGLLWPGFMKHAGPIIGMPFSWEGTAFFLEAIALGLFLYGWNQMHPWVHWFAGVMVGVCGFMSGIFVLSVNAWMNAPTGFDWVDGEALNVDPVKAMFNDAWFSQSLHMQLAALTSVGFAVAGVHALLLLKRKRTSLNTSALYISLTIGAIAALLQPLSGHYAAQDVAKRQPIKLAAMEAHFHTEKGAPIVIGGIPNVETGEVPYAIKIPKVLSFLAFNDFDAEVKGLFDFERELWPPVLIVHIAFQVMVGIGSFLALLSLFYFFTLFRKRPLPQLFLKALVFAIPLGFIATEAGWIVTEVGRQPWIIYGIMKTKDALTPMPGIQYHFYLFTFVYCILTVASGWLMYRQVKAVAVESDLELGQ